MDNYTSQLREASSAATLDRLKQDGHYEVVEEIQYVILPFLGYLSGIKLSIDIDQLKKRVEEIGFDQEMGFKYWLTKRLEYYRNKYPSFYTL